MFILITARSLSFHFELKQGKKRCFIEELYIDNMAMIKYSVKGLEAGNESEKNSYFTMINIRVSHIEDQNNKPIDKYLTSSEGKITFTAKKEGQYNICVFPFPSTWTPTRPLMELTILSDNMDEPNLVNALKKEDVDKLHDKIEDILYKGNKYIYHQNTLISFEDKDSNSIIKVQKIFFYLTILQIITVIALGVYQLKNFKLYLDNNVLDF